MTSKQEVRRKLLDKRHALSQKRREEAREALLKDLYPKLNAFKYILSFASKEEEIDLWPLNAILAKEGSLLLPRLVNALEIEPFKVEDLEHELVIHPKWKVWEPSPELCSRASLDQISCVLVPGVGFDFHHQRIGYGKGFYDRFLRHLSCPFYGIGFKEQCLESPLSVESHDIPLTDTFLF